MKTESRIRWSLAGIRAVAMILGVLTCAAMVVCVGCQDIGNANVINATTTVTMPAHSVTVTATYASIRTLTVIDPDGTTYWRRSEGSSLEVINTGPPGQVFVRWTGDIDHMSDAYSQKTTFYFPDHDWTVTAIYK